MHSSDVGLLTNIWKRTIVLNLNTLTLKLYCLCSYLDHKECNLCHNSDVIHFCFHFLNSLVAYWVTINVKYMVSESMPPSYHIAFARIWDNFLLPPSRNIFFVDGTHYTELFRWDTKLSPFAQFPPIRGAYV